MSKTKSHKEDEDYKGRIRELEKLNKALKKRLRQLEKSKHIWTENKLDEDEQTILEEKTKLNAIKCSACEEGTLISIDLGIKYLLTCSSCKFRKLLPK